MAQRVASDLQSFFDERASGKLRSIVVYEPEEFTITYLRDDVADQYSESELRAAVDESRMESFTEMQGGSPRL